MKQTKETTTRIEVVDTLLSKITKEQVLSVMMEHQEEISAWFSRGQAGGSVASRGEKSADDPVMLLPKRLRMKLRHRVAFRKAFSRGFIEVEEGEVVSRFRSVSMLSYFCGRCFSGDVVEVIHHRRYVRRGGSSFPARELERFFGVENLKDSRKNLMNKKIPAWYQDVDSLFDT